jgi:O-antigen/teichoic acid export membrane protein
MISYLKKLLFSNTSKDSLISFSGVVISAIFGFLLTFLLSGNLSPSQLGIFVTALTFSLLVADLFDLGVNSSVLNFVSSSSGNRKQSFIKATLLIRIAIISLIGVILLVFGGPISIILFANQSITPLIQMSALGIAFTMIVTWGQAVFQSEKRFLLSSIIGSSVNLLRLLVVYVLITGGIFNYLNSYFLLQIIILIPALLIFLKLGYKFFDEKTTLLQYKDIFKFGLPIGLSFSIFAISSRLDQIMVLKLLGEDEAGFYGLAYRLAMSLFFLAASFSAVITPRFASISPQDFFSYFKKTLVASFGISALAILAIPAIPLIFPLLFKNEYDQSIVPLQILTLAMSFFILSIPYSYAILYRYKNSSFALWASILNLILIWFLLNFLIPSFGIIGAAFSITLVYFIQLLISAAYFFYIWRKNNAKLFSK